MELEAKYKTLEWVDSAPRHLRLLDQTRLPRELGFLEIHHPASLIEAIRELAVRGAPAIGVAAAYGVVLAAMQDPGQPRAAISEWTPRLRASRPTAVNLFHALDRLSACAEQSELDGEALIAALLEEAKLFHREDEDLCLQMAKHGSALLSDGMRVLTHCNTGALATAGIGTALGVVFHASVSGKRIEVYFDETRPLMQGSRLTFWELEQRRIPATLLPDSAAAGLLLGGEIDAVLVGADRIARNGDTANKVGTLSVALAAKRAAVPFYVVAPSTSFDGKLADGSGIPIEERSTEEVFEFLRPDAWSESCRARNPAFDVTPADLITAIVTELGVVRDPNEARVKELLTSGR